MQEELEEQKKPDAVEKPEERQVSEAGPVKEMAEDKTVTADSDDDSGDGIFLFLEDASDEDTDPKEVETTRTAGDEDQGDEVQGEVDADSGASSMETNGAETADTETSGAGEADQLVSAEEMGSHKSSSTDAGASISEAEGRTLSETDGNSAELELVAVIADANSNSETEVSSVSAEVDSDSELEDDPTDESSGRSPELSDSPGEPAAKSQTTELRRSGRDRKEPRWFHSEDFPTRAHNQQAVGVSRDPSELLISRVDWEQKAEFLAKLAMTDTFARIPDSFCRAILKLVTEQ
jgi:hypothetical protein